MIHICVNKCQWVNPFLPPFKVLNYWYRTSMICDICLWLIFMYVYLIVCLCQGKIVQKRAMYFLWFYKGMQRRYIGMERCGVGCLILCSELMEIIMPDLCQYYWAKKSDWWHFISLGLEQFGCTFADGIFQMHFLEILKLNSSVTLVYFC